MHREIKRNGKTCTLQTASHAACQEDAFRDRDPALLAQGLVRPLYKLPYSDLNDLQHDVLKKKQQNAEAVVFGHSLTDLIGGQLAAGFSIDGFYEDEQPHQRFLLDRYMPTFIATRALKR